MTFFLVCCLMSLSSARCSTVLAERLEAYDDNVATFVVSDELRKEIVVKMN